MTDSIQISIKHFQLPTDFYQQAYQKFKNQRTTIHEETNQVWGTAKFHNFFCTFNAYGLSMTGSITKYFYGTNQYNLNKDDFEKAIEQLGRELNVDLKDCTVSRLDIAENIITKEPVEHYYKYFGEAKGLTRYVLNNGLEYRNTVSTISIYNKTKELKKNNVKPIPIFEGKNILRFEYRALAAYKVGQIFGAKKVKVIDIINNYELLTNAWLKSFKGIFKNHDLMVFHSSVFTDGKGFEKQLVLAGIDALGGGQYILETIKEARKAKLFRGHKNIATNLTRKIKDVLQTPVLTQKSPLMDELEKKVRLVQLVVSNNKIGETDS